MEIRDTGKILAICATVISMFSLSDLQAAEVKTYVKNNMYSWVAQRKQEADVEAMIKSEASRVSR